jgi:protein-ribulosamine 3-kinase
VTLPGSLRAAIEERLGPVRAAEPVSGGCINNAMRVETTDGPVFLKYNPDAPPGLFAAEAHGLEALRRAADGALRIPRVLAHGEPGDGAPSWLAMEWLAPGRRGDDFDARLGRGLAALHAAPADPWGWDADNFIGPLPQANRPVGGGWAAFWRTRRLEPQLALARRDGRLPAREDDWTRLFERLPELLAPAEADGPSLLHGDLWGGNVVAAEAGPALIDPAVYHGHGEADLAMTELFGGFGADFHAAYREARPLQDGYETRRAVYQLYYLLVHVNLFGGGYVQQTAETLRRAAAA